MRFQYLGTAASEAVPAIFCECDMCNEARRRGGRDLRTRSCAVVNENLMLDFGPDAYVQTARFGVHLSKIKTLLITHPHSDHFYTSNLYYRGGFWGMNLAEDVLTVCGGKEVYETCDKYFANHNVSEVTKHLAAKKLVHGEMFDDGNYLVMPLHAVHAGNLECFVYLIESKADGKRVLYLHDTEDAIDDSLDIIKGTHCDLVSFDCTGGSLGFDPGCGHMGFLNNITMRDKLAARNIVDSSTRLVCSHICHHRNFHDDLSREFAREGFEVAYDGMILEL